MFDAEICFYEVIVQITINFFPLHSGSGELPLVPFAAGG